MSSNSFAARSWPIAAALAALSLGACAHTDLARTPTEQFPLRAEASPQVLQLAPHADGLSENQRKALNAFLGGWQDGGGAITIQAATGGGAAAYRTSAAAQFWLVNNGVPESQVRIVGYDGGGDPAAPVRVAFDRYSAVVPQCGQDWENLSRSGGNGTYKNFGCAVNANLAAMVANPADLARPHDVDPADGGRRATVLDKYRKGEITASAKDDQANGAVSKAVQ